MAGTGQGLQCFEVKHIPIPIRPSLFLASILWMLIGTGCVSSPPSALVPNVNRESYWGGDAMTGSPSVRISLSRQRAYFYKGGALAGVSRISSGREGLDTVTGHYRILEKDREHRSSLFGDYLGADGEVVQKDVDTSKDPMPPGATYQGANMPNWMRITGATGMHTGFLPGYPASHGCIRMPDFMAAAFFRSLEVGTPVSIEP